MRSDEDTIFAPATALGRAAVGIIRVSGDGVRRIPEMFGFSMPGARVAGLRTLKDGAISLDQALVLFFPKPGSYTGEDLVELQIHGGRAVYDAVVSVLTRQIGLRFAEPGEFSRRAVLNGRLDLTEAEAVNDLVNAETEQQRNLAVAQMGGSLARVFDQWATKLTGIRAHLEAYIDFPDEEIPEEVYKALETDLRGMLGETTAFLDDDRRGERLREGMRIAVVGPPNAGKSSFVNWLAERDVAIVTGEAGTTRDVIEVHLDLGGYPVTVADTAGLRESVNLAEIEGIRRARAWARDADIRIFMVDATDPDIGFEAEVRPKEHDLVLVNKIDLIAKGHDKQILRQKGGAWEMPVSVATGDGLGEVLQRLSEIAHEWMNVSAGPVMSRARHRAALQACVAALEEGQAELKAGAPPEIVAEHLRFASDSIGRVTGRVDVEDLLDVVFRDFCIGK